MMLSRTPYTPFSSFRRSAVVFLAAVLVSAVLLSCRERTPASPPATPFFPCLNPTEFDENAAYHHLRILTQMGLRDSGTPGAERAAQYIRDQLLDLDLEVTYDVFTNATPRGPTVFRNVVGRVPGRNSDLIIVGSHYDTKSGMPEGFQGANDSGSSTAVLLELARVLVKAPSIGPEVWLAFFDGEECMVRYGPHDGLHGSRRLAEYLVESGRSGSVKAVIILDMIGDCDLTVTIPRNSSPQLVQLALATAQEEGVRHMFSLFRHEILDDHEPFLRLNMPAIDLIDFHYGSAPGLNDYWHTAADRLERVCPESLGIMGRVTLRMLNRLAL